MPTEYLIDQLGYNHGVLKMNLQDLSHEESLVAPPNGGNCINWVVGHVVATRNVMLKVLGQDPVWDDEHTAVYKRGSKPLAAADALPLGDILDDFNAAQETLVDALRALPAEGLKAKSPMSFFKGEEETIGSVMAAFIFHESYHVGQTGLLRRIAGKEGAIK